MTNLIKNHSFEEGLKGWTFTNVEVVGENPYEGTSVARLGSGTASLVQKIKLDDDEPLQLYFAVQSLYSFSPGDLTVQLEWLNKKGKTISTGVSMLIPSSTLGNQLFWLTYANITDEVPDKAKEARITFSKTSGSDNDTIDIDNVLLMLMED